MIRFEFELSDEMADHLTSIMARDLTRCEYDMVLKGMTHIREPVKFEYGNGNITVHLDSEEYGKAIIALYICIDHEGGSNEHRYNIPISDLKALIKEKRELDGE